MLSLRDSMHRTVMRTGVMRTKRLNDGSLQYTLADVMVLIVLPLLLDSTSSILVIQFFNNEFHSSVWSLYKRGQWQHCEGASGDTMKGPVATL